MANKFKTFALMTILTILFVWVGGLIAGKTGSLIAFLLALGMNFFSYWFSDKLVLKHYQAKEIGAGDSSGIYEIASELVSRANLPMPKVYLIPQQTANAFATGRNPNHAAVAVTSGILQLLDRHELKGVIAHELSHIKHRDILTGTIIATIAGALTMLGQFAQIGGLRSQKRNNPLLVILLMVGAPLAAMLIRMAISRTREYAADEAAGRLSKAPLALANALHKLQTGVAKYPLQNGNPAHANMFIIHPFLGGGMARLFSTHPPTEARIKKLEALQEAM